MRKRIEERVDPWEGAGVPARDLGDGPGVYAGPRAVHGRVYGPWRVPQQRKRCRPLVCPNELMTSTRAGPSKCFYPDPVKRRIPQSLMALPAA